MSDEKKLHPHTIGERPHRLVEQKAQLYTDGLGGHSDHNLERTYNVSRKLISRPDLAEQDPLRNEMFEGAAEAASHTASEAE